VRKEKQMGEKQIIIMSLGEGTDFEKRERD
jgi:hypothetical protein